MPAATRTSKPSSGAPVSVVAGRAAVAPPKKKPSTAAVIPQGPSIKLKENPALKDPRFKKVMGKLQHSAHRAKQHPPASQKANEAQAAAYPPPHEKLAGAQANNVDGMKGAQTKKPESTSFLTMLRAEIQKALPKKTEDGDDFMKGDDKRQLKGAMTGNISQQKQEASAGMKAASNAPPDTSKVPGKEVTPLAAVPAPVQPSAIGAADAMPAPKTEADVSLEQGKKDADKAMSDNKLTTPQLQKANDPRFSAVLTAKSKVDTQAAALPQKYRGTETQVLSQAGAKAVAGEHKGFAAFKGHQGKSGAGVRTHQLTAKEKDEARRKEVTDHIESIYAKTKDTVDKKLERLDTEVSDMFDAGTEAAIAVMKDYVETRFDDRYSGIRGKARWVKDKFWPLPDSVKKWFDDSFVVFLQALDDLVVRIANLVETRLQEAKDEVGKGQKEIAKYVDGLDPDLKKVGLAAEKEMVERFDDLRAGIEDKKTDLAQSLAQRYKEAYDKGATALQAMRDAHKSLVERVVDAIKEVVEVLRNFKNRIMAMIKKAAEAIDLIISDPIGFLSNLLDAIKLGISQFRDHIWEHLQEGFMAWLFGTLGDAGIKLPKDFSLGSILLLVLEILGITYDKLRRKAVKLIGPRAVTMVETVGKVIYEMVTTGPEKLWEQAQEFLGNLKETIINGIKEWAITAIIKAAVTKLATMFNPVGAIIQAILTIYNTVIFFIQRINQILDFVQAILDSVLDIAKGNIASAANWIEKALARAIPIIISFLAALLGLGGISGKIKEIVKKLQDTVDKAMDMVIAKVVAGVKKVIGVVTGKSKEKEKETPAQDLRDRAGQLVLQRAGGNHSEEEIRKAIADVRDELKPHGLIRLDLEPDGEDGEMALMAQASGPKKVGKTKPTTPKIKTRSVVMVARIVLDQDALKALERAGGNPIRFFPHDLPRARSGQPPGAVSGMQDAAMIGSPPDEQMRYGTALLRPAPTSKEIKVMSWNSGFPTGSNASHAENFFSEWLIHSGIKDSIQEIHISINFSPCSLCVGSLPKFQAPVQASLSYTIPYIGSEPETNLLAANSTTVDDLNRLGKKGWQVSGPTITMTDDFKDKERKAGRRIMLAHVD